MVEWVVEIVSRKDARAAGLTRYFTGAPCKRGHVAERLTSIRACLLCQKGHIKSWCAGHKDYFAAAAAKHRRRYPEQAKAALVRLRGYASDPAKRAAGVARCKKRHPEKYRAIANAVGARYRADKRNAALPWLSAEQRKQILSAYDEAVALTKSTSIRHEVDHIVPLRGKAVSGLHVPWNLQVIPMRENRSKGNRLTV